MALYGKERAFSCVERKDESLQKQTMAAKTSIPRLVPLVAMLSIFVFISVDRNAERVAFWLEGREGGLRTLLQSAIKTNGVCLLLLSVAASTTPARDCTMGNTLFSGTV